LATKEEFNEIPAIHVLLDNININNATVTIDAAGCQKNIAAKIIDKGGDYLLALKGNQGTLYLAAMDWVIEQMKNDFSTTTVERYVETTKGHGREDTVEYFHLPVPKTLPRASLWKNLRTIGVAVRTSLQGGKETTDIRFFISSLSLGVRRFAAIALRMPRSLGYRKHSSLVAGRDVP
jgi:predicted transposase YbfD/YdcC